MQPLYDYCDVIWSNSDQTSFDKTTKIAEEGNQGNTQEKDQRRNLRETAQRAALD